MKLKDKQAIINNILEISSYIYQFNYRYQGKAPIDWNPLVLFPHSMQLIDPCMHDPDESKKLKPGEPQLMPWSIRDTECKWEFLKNAIKNEYESKSLNYIDKRYFITSEWKNKNQQVIGFYYYDEKAVTRLIILDLNRFNSLTYTLNHNDLQNDTESGRPTILNSDTLLERAYELVADYSLYPIEDYELLSINKAFNCKPKFSTIFKKYDYPGAG